MDSFVLSPLTEERSRGFDVMPPACAVARGATLTSAAAVMAAARTTTVVRMYASRWLREIGSKGSWWCLTLAMTRESRVDQPVKAEPPNNPADGDDGRSPALERIHQRRGKPGQSEKL